MSLKNYGNTAEDNKAASTAGFTEGEGASVVNDTFRQIMADLRTWYEDAQWIDEGDVPEYISATSFKMPGDRTAEYHLGRRLKITDTTTLYGKVATTTYTAPFTTITVTLDGGSITNSISAVCYGQYSVVNPSIDQTLIGSGDLAVKDTLDSSALIDAGVVTAAKLDDIEVLEKIETIAFAGESNKEFTTGITTSYKRLVLVLRDIVTSTDTSIVLTVSDDTGSTYKTTGYEYAGHGRSANGDQTNNFEPNASNIPLTDGISNAVSNYAFNSESTIFAPTSTAAVIYVKTNALAPDSLGSIRASKTFGVYEHATVIHIDGIKVATTAGTFTSGQATLYGVVNAI